MAQDSVIQSWKRNRMTFSEIIPHPAKDHAVVTFLMMAKELKKYSIDILGRKDPGVSTIRGFQTSTSSVKTGMMMIGIPKTNEPIMKFGYVNTFVNGEVPWFSVHNPSEEEKRCWRECRTLEVFRREVPVLRSIGENIEATNQKDWEDRRYVEDTSRKMINDYVWKNVPEEVAGAIPTYRTKFMARTGWEIV